VSYSNMRRWGRGAALAAAIIFTSTSSTLAPARADNAATIQSPQLRLITAQNDISEQSSGGYVSLDPGIWVASDAAPLEFQIWRTSYTKPLHIEEILHTASGGTEARELPASLIGSVPTGLLNFMNLTVQDSSGKVLDTVPVTLCPNSLDPERVNPDGPDSSPYPQFCATEPFPVGARWVIQKDWAVDPLEFQAPTFQLQPGTYKVTETISPSYRSVFNIVPANAMASVNVTVTAAADSVRQTGSPVLPTVDGLPQAGPMAASADVSAEAPAQGISSPGSASSADVPDMTNPPESALPDLVALPAWDISTSNVGGRDLLDFGATVWDAGNAPLDVEGFRSGGSPTMNAYQFFYENGKVIGKAPAGTMGFADYNRWHFEQFAEYNLLTAAKKLATPSQKEGFCIGPTDPVDQLLPQAPAQPPLLLPGVIECGVPTALWVRENLPVGWGDTYLQSVPGQSFDITSIPNGTYYIEVVANPEKLLHETTTSNGTSLREVILGGTRGHRTVQVPAWNGIDPEG
jgi:hypothetical protein